MLHRVIDTTYALSGLYQQLHVCMYAFYTARLLLCVQHYSILAYCILHFFPTSHSPHSIKLDYRSGCTPAPQLCTQQAGWCPDPTIALVISQVWHAPHSLTHPLQFTCYHHVQHVLHLLACPLLVGCAAATPLYLHFAGCIASMLFTPRSTQQPQSLLLPNVLCGFLVCSSLYPLRRAVVFPKSANKDTLAVYNMPFESH